MRNSSTPDRDLQIFLLCVALLVVLLAVSTWLSWLPDAVPPWVEGT